MVEIKYVMMRFLIALQLFTCDRNKPFTRFRL